MYNSTHFIRFCFLTTYILTYLIDYPVLFYYITVLFLLYELIIYLNTKKTLINHEILGVNFVAFIGFIILVRSDYFNYNETISYYLNTFEHIFFAFIICKILYFYLLYFRFQFNNELVTFFLFNCIGILNEFFQNWIQNQSLFTLTQSSIKDILVNCFGSLFFIIFYSKRNRLIEK